MSEIIYINIYLYTDEDYIKTVCNFNLPRGGCRGLVGTRWTQSRGLTYTALGQVSQKISPHKPKLSLAQFNLNSAKKSSLKTPAFHFIHYLNTHTHARTHKQRCMTL